jgi:hypothetical protein
MCVSPTRRFDGGRYPLRRSHSTISSHRSGLDKQNARSLKLLEPLPIRPESGTSFDGYELSSLAIHAMVQPTCIRKVWRHMPSKYPDLESVNVPVSEEKVSEWTGVRNFRRTPSEGIKQAISWHSSR